MARRRAAAGRARGGDLVQAPRPARPRLATGAAAVACELALTSYAAARATPWNGLAAAAGVALALALAVAIVLRRPGAVPWSLFGLGALYAATLRGTELDGWSIGYGAGLLLAAELAYWSIEHERLVREERVVVLRRAATVGGLVAASLLAGLVVVAVAGLDVGAGLPLAAAGTAAAVGLLVLVARLARSG